MAGLNKLQVHVFGRKVGFVPSWDVETLKLDETGGNALMGDISGIHWREDGNVLFTSSGNSSSIFKLEANRPFSVIGLTLVQSLVLSNNIQGVRVSPNGLIMFLVEYGSGIVRRYDLSTPWDLSTAVLTASKNTVNTMTGIYLKSDGSAFYLSHRGLRIYRYNMPTPWDLSTSVSAGFITLSNGEDYLTGLYFKPDGEKMYVLSFTGERVTQYHLSTPWDLSTAVYEKYKSIPDVNDLFITDDGHYFYLGHLKSIARYKMIL